VNLDVPAAPEDYIHRVGRTARAELKGDAFTFVAPDEETDLRNIERAIGRRLPRVTVPDFNYSAKPEGKLEIPLAERLAKHRANKAGDRMRAAENAKRRGNAPAGGSRGPGGSGAGRGGRGGGRSR
jgi:ATP-dependent RNA helicase RhlE